VRFTDLTFNDIARAARRGSVAVVPLGCTEQQGPHLSVGFDTWFADELCTAASEQALEQHGIASLVLPVLPFGPTPEHRGFGSGYVDLPITVHDAVLDAVLVSLADQGFERILVWRGCGGHGLVDAVRRCNRRWTGRVRVTLPEHPFHDIWCRVGDPNIPGGHADSFATSIALHRHPEHVRLDLVPGASAAPDWSAPGLDFTEHSSTGVIGDARAASAELGEQLWEACVTALAALIRDTAVDPKCVGVQSLPTAPRDG
jgi:creatinine amidohydrolase